MTFLKMETTLAVLGDDRRSATQSNTSRHRRVTAIQLYRSLLLMITLPLAEGCSLLHEEPISIPHGTPISIDQIPASVIDQTSLPHRTIAERYDDNGSFRIEYPDGGITILDSQGSFQGGVM